MEVVNECDALFWVIDVNNGTINQSSLAVIREKLEKPLYIIVNKVDTKSSNEVEKVVDVISSTLRSKGVEYKQIIRFSKLEDIDQLMTVIRSIRKTGQAEDYFRRVQGQLNILEGNLRREDEITRENANTQIQRLSLAMRGDINVLNAIVTRIRDYRRRIIDLPNRRTTWLGFGENEYVMTKQERQAFVRLLDDMANAQLKQLIDKIESLQKHAMDFGGASKEAAHKLNEIAEKYTRVSEHQEQFEKLLKGLANGGQTRQTSYQDSGKSQKEIEEEIEYERRLRDYQNLFNG